MVNIIPIDQARGLGPTRMRDRMAQGTALTNRYADGVADAFPRLSIRGKVFRTKVDGKEFLARDSSGHALQFLDVILVNASAQLAKTYYEKGYVENDANAPDCWSLDSVRPDASIPRRQLGNGETTPINPTCPDCKMNAFGSRITPDGKGAKACSDSRRIALTFPHELADPAKAPTVYLLRVPQSSLKNMRNYTIDQLARNGYEPGGCVTRLSFDDTLSYPKLRFEFTGPLNDQEFDKIEALANSPFVASMLRSPDFDNTASAAAVNATPPQQPTQRQAAPNFGPEQGQTTTQGFFHVPVQPPTEEAEDEWVEVEGDQLLNLSTGEIKAKPVESNALQDPDVITTSDGRFFNRRLKKFVEGPYLNAVPQPITAALSNQPAVEAKAPAKPRGRPAKAKEATAVPAVEEGPKGNGNDEEAVRPTVVAASPKLEQLLGALKPKT